MINPKEWRIQTFPSVEPTDSRSSPLWSMLLSSEIKRFGATEHQLPSGKRLAIRTKNPPIAWTFDSQPLTTEDISNLMEVVRRSKNTTCVLHHLAEINAPFTLATIRKPAVIPHVRGPVGIPEFTLNNDVGALQLESFQPTANDPRYHQALDALASFYTRDHIASGASNGLRVFDDVLCRFGSTFHLLITRERRIKATLLSWMNHDSNLCSFSSMAVNPEKREKGLASFLVSSVARKLAENGIAGFFAWIEEDNLPSLRVFQKLGFEQLPEKFMRTEITISK